MKLVENKARCKNCNTVIKSFHKHDFVVCKCFTRSVNNKGIFLDGGTAYIRVGGNLNNYVDLSVWEDSSH